MVGLSIELIGNDIPLLRLLRVWSEPRKVQSIATLPNQDYPEESVEFAFTGRLFCDTYMVRVWSVIWRCCQKSCPALQRSSMLSFFVAQTGLTREIVLARFAEVRYPVVSSLMSDEVSLALVGSVVLRAQSSMQIVPGVV